MLHGFLPINIEGAGITLSVGVCSLLVPFILVSLFNLEEKRWLVHLAPRA